MIKGGVNTITHDFYTVRLLAGQFQTDIVEYFFTETEALTFAKCDLRAYDTIVQKETLTAKLEVIK